MLNGGGSPANRQGLHFLDISGRLKRLFLCIKSDDDKYALVIELLTI
jgi:hypothetical protein